MYYILEISSKGPVKMCTLPSMSESIDAKVMKTNDDSVSLFKPCRRTIAITLDHVVFKKITIFSYTQTLICVSTARELKGTRSVY